MYLPQLDGLRFFAFLLVFLHHSPEFPGGGRVASSREHEATGLTDFKTFFIRRALRIWPLFYLYVGACFLYFLAFDGKDTVVLGRTIGHVFFLDNFFTAIAGKYNPLNFTPHLWTIAFEEQIVRGCLDDRSWIAWLLGQQPLVFFGRISYGLYVWHWVGNEFSPRLTHAWLTPHVNATDARVGWFVAVLPALALTIALSSVSYFALERPFLRIKRRFTLAPNRAD